MKKLSLKFWDIFHTDNTHFKEVDKKVENYYGILRNIKE
jgi:hypothetical protein